MHAALDQPQTAAMPRFSIPFIPTRTFAEAVAARRSAVHSMYVALGEHTGLDARLTLTRWDVDRLVETLSMVKGIRVYALINGRWIPPQRYLDPKALNPLCSTLDRLITEVDLAGLVFADLYFLSSLGAASGDIAKHLEAVPSVNFMLDAAPKIESVIAAIARTPFRRPRRLVLDRSLNRDMIALERVSLEIRSRYPGMAVGLIANEGCLFHCPFKGAHDALIAMAQQAPPGDLLHRLNRDLGCMAHLEHQPADLLKSPFIRPEDAAAYAPSAQFIKLCGRTLGEAFVIATLDAYISGRFHGNLLDILDAPAALRDRLVIPNHQIPEAFHDTVTHCDKACAACGYCDAVFAGIGRWQTAPLVHLTTKPVPEAGDTRLQTP
jgi:hypothetical protein